jgi:hypothetical protein
MCRIWRGYDAGRVLSLALPVTSGHSPVVPPELTFVSALLGCSSGHFPLRAGQSRARQSSIANRRERRPLKGHPRAAGRPRSGSPTSLSASATSMVAASTRLRRAEILASSRPNLRVRAYDPLFRRHRLTVGARCLMSLSEPSSWTNTRWLWPGVAWEPWLLAPSLASRVDLLSNVRIMKSVMVMTRVR